MFYYCENCNALSERDDCQFCGRKKLRQPEKKDYCFLVEADFMFGAMFEGMLDDKSIPYVDCPVGNGVRSQFALKLDKLQIFVPYEFFIEAKELLYEIFANMEESLRRDFLENIDRLFVSPRNEKKIKKALGMVGHDSLVAYCLDQIMNADSMVNKGRISGCRKGGDYIVVYKGTELIMVNSATYEIISVEKVKKGKGM